MENESELFLIKDSEYKHFYLPVFIQLGEELSSNLVKYIKFFEFF